LRGMQPCFLYWGLRGLKLGLKADHLDFIHDSLN
jgi:hypothetical protein